MNAVSIVAFTRDGTKLAQKVAAALGGRAWAPAKYANAAGNDPASVTPLDGSLADWTRRHFGESGALIFVSACGIAVRGVAPLLKDKTRDPAVVCLDDRGENVIALLSGHLGGANDLALKIAGLTGGRAVVTTATDVHGVRAVDTWAKDQDCAIENPGAIKSVSSAILDGGTVGVAVTEQIMPAPWPATLWLRPRNLVLGAGCKRGTPFESLRGAAADFLDGAGVSPLSLRALASVDAKADEPGLNALAESFKIPFLVFPASELAGVPGRFSRSERVLAAVGVDNVCERAAVLGAELGPLLRSKTIYPGVTFALARIRPGGTIYD